MLRSLKKFSQLIFQGNVWRSVWRICMWILGLKGSSLVWSETRKGLRDPTKLCTQMFLCREFRHNPSRERLLQRNGPEWATEGRLSVLWFILIDTQQLHFSKLKIYETGCIEALGMESRAIRDAQLSASSQWGGGALHAPSQGRLNFRPYSNKAGAWCPRKNDSNPWLQVDLGNYITVTRVATQGRNGWGNWWVTKYRLLYSDSGITFHYYKDTLDNSAKVNFIFFLPLFTIITVFSSSV